MAQNNLQIDDAHDYLQKVIESLRGLDRREKGPMVAILEYISGYIRESREEIKALRLDEDGVPIATAADELEEIVTEAMNATNTIMGAAEAIEAVADGLADAQAADKMRQEATRIYEACGFQDITGQRITKVVRTLQSIEKRVNALALVCGAELDAAKPAAADKKSEDEKLLNGPALSGGAKTQDEIDALFDSLN